MIRFEKNEGAATISDNFTFANVHHSARAISGHLIKQKLTNLPVIVGYDSRFLADKFAQEAALVFKTAGINVLLPERDTPLPVLAWTLKEVTFRSLGHKASCAVVINGKGGIAETLGIDLLLRGAGQLASLLAREISSDRGGEITAAQPGVLEHFEPRKLYLEMIAEKVSLAKKLRIVVDPLFGSGRGYLDLLLQQLGCFVEEIHGYRDVLFGGKVPGIQEDNLTELKARVLELKADLGVALDSSAENYAVVDNQGRYYASARLPENGRDGILGAAQLIAAVADKGLRALTGF